MEFLWDPLDDLDGNLCHIIRHGISATEVEAVLLDPNSETTTSRSTGRPITFGYTMNGRYLAVVWQYAGRDVRPITAYDVRKPRTLRKRN
jgi:uncharacterized DUF497 family protein